MVEVTKEFKFCAAHRLLGYDGPCSNLHGHNYRAEVTVASERLDGLGMVLDFGILKMRIGEWIDRKWDHGLLLNSEDRDLIEANENHSDLFLFTKSNPTAERMVQVLFIAAEGELAGIHGIILKRIRLYETDSSWAEVTSVG